MSTTGIEMAGVVAVLPTEAGVRAEVVTGFAGLEKLAEDWKRLWSSDPQRHVFLSWPWVRAWWRAYGREHRLFTPVVWDGSRLIGILPVVREGGTLHFLGSPDADYTDALCEEERAVEVVQAAFEALFRTAPPWRRCVFENVPEKSRLARSVAQLPPRLKRRLGVSYKASCPAIVAGPQERDPFRTLARKESIRRHDKKLRGLGEVGFRHLETRSEIETHLPNFVRQHIARRAMAGDRSLLLSPDAVEFYRALVEELDPCGELRFSVLEAGETPLAYHMGFQSDGKFIWYKPTFDVDYWDWSPGEVLIGRLMQYASDRGLGEFDFTLGDEAFKYRFANVVRRLYRLNLYAPGMRGQALRLFHAAREAAKLHSPLFRWAKDNAERVKRWLKAIRRRGALEVAGGWLARALRAVVAWDEALILFGKPGLGETDNRPAGLVVGTALLSELTQISLEYPGDFRPEYLREARERLKRGDVCYVARLRGRPAQVAWVATREEIAFPEFGRECKIDLHERAAVIFDMWTEPSERGGETYPAVVSRIAQAQAMRGLATCAWCRPGDPTARHGIERAGLKPGYRIGQIRLFGLRRRYSRVLQQ